MYAMSQAGIWCCTFTGEKSSRSQVVIRLLGCICCFSCLPREMKEKSLPVQPLRDTQAPECDRSFVLCRAPTGAHNA